MFALMLEAGYEQRTSNNVRTLWGALVLYLSLILFVCLCLKPLFGVNILVYRCYSISLDIINVFQSPLPNMGGGPSV